MFRLAARVRVALWRARFAVWTMAVTYALSLLTGIFLSHAGNRLAVDQRDKIVGTARRESAIFQELHRGNAATSAALDAAGNALGSMAGFVAGYFPPAGYGMAAYKGWVGGIVSIDDSHRSRLRKPYDAFYYLTTILLQLLPATLVGAAGINLAYAAFMDEARTGYRGPRLSVFRIPYDALRDAGWIWLISLPLFSVASTFEFLA